MARLFQTGFEMGTWPDTDYGSGFGGTASGRGSWSTYSLGPSNATAGWVWAASVSDFYFGIGLLHTGTVGDKVISFLSPNAVTNVQLDFNNSQAIVAQRGDGTALGTASGTYATNSTWYYLTGHIVIHDTTGSVTLNKNGVQVLSVTSVDTRNDAGTNGDKCDHVILKPVNTNVDDLWMNDTTGSFNNGDSGDIRIKAYIPSSAGDVTGLTPSTGSNFTAVDDVPANDDTDYVFGTDTTSYDLYNVPNTSNTGSVQAVTIWLRAKKSDAGAANIAHKIKSGSSGATESTGADVALTTSYKFYGKTYDSDPADSAAWTAARVDTMQIGAKSR